VLDGRKLSAMKYWGMIEDASGKFKLTDRGRLIAGQRRVAARGSPSGDRFGAALFRDRGGGSSSKPRSREVGGNQRQAGSLSATYMDAV
jgi:hypothetical protein